MNWMKYSLAILTTLLFVNIGLADDLKDYTKKYQESWSVKPGVNLQIENKYGPIKVDVWDKNEVAIEVIVLVKSSSESKAQKVLDMIDIRLIGDEYEVIGTTSLIDENNNNSWWEKIFSSYESGNYEVTYNINVPEETKFDITNKYGHIYLNQPTVGNARLINKYGNIYATHIDGELNLDIGYGNAKFGNVGNTEIDIKYGKVITDDAGDVHINSKYSEIKLGNIGKLEVYSKYDDYKVESATSFKNEGKYDDFAIARLQELDIATKYSSIDIEHISHKVKLDGKYNDLKVRSTANTLKSVDVEGKYTHVKLAIDHGYKLALIGEYLSFDLPDGFSKKVYIKDGEDLEVKGTYGDGHTRIRVEQEYGSFKIYHK